MNRSLPKFVLLLCSLAALSQAHAADVVLTMESYGPVRVGMTVAEVHEQLLKLGRKHLPNPRKTAKKGCDHYQASERLSFMTEDGRVVRIETSEPEAVTPSGIRVGSSIEKVRRAFGSRIEDMQQKYSENEAERTIVLVSGDKRFAIRVEAGATVTEIYAGAEHAIRYVEGCA